MKNTGMSFHRRAGYEQGQRDLTGRNGDRAGASEESRQEQGWEADG
jgi:hypothetical protein